MTNALHANDGDHHVVGIGDLRVVLTKDDAHGGWFAQGLEIDYAAQGSSMDEAKDRFAQGLILTIREHLKRFRSIERLLSPAPSDVWREYTLPMSAHQMSLHLVSTHDLTSELRAAELPPELSFPFPKIQYLAPEMRA